MLALGEIKKGNEIGKKSIGKFIWHACIDCGKERWVDLRRGLPRHLHCHSCASKRKPHYSVGLFHENGYRKIYLKKDDPYYPMAQSKGYIFEHRYIMAKHLGRCLERWEIVHHKNNVRDDNRIENLELLKHQRYHVESIMMMQEINRLRARVTILEAEVVLLRIGDKEKVV